MSLKCLQMTVHVAEVDPWRFDRQLPAEHVVEHRLCPVTVQSHLGGTQRARIRIVRKSPLNTCPEKTPTEVK